MKWLSVKKYTPLIGMEYFITDSEFIYTGEYTINGWVNTSLDVEIGNITHFCIPGPIEIEE